MKFSYADLHCHSRHSDGVEEPAVLVQAAKEAGLRALSLTDHDSLEGVAAARAAAGDDLEIIAGAELSCFSDGEDVHILGLFLDPSHPALAVKLQGLREIRSQRGEAMVDRLVAQGMKIDAAAIRATVGGGAFGRPHVARALIAAGYATDMDDAFDRWLNRDRPGFVDKPRLGPQEAIELIHAAGGVASIAHPIWSRDAEALIRSLVSSGLDAVEVRHPDHEPENESRFARLATELDLLVTAGSDFHEPGRGRTIGQSTVSHDELERLRSRRSRR